MLLVTRLECAVVFRTRLRFGVCSWWRSACRSLPGGAFGFVPYAPAGARDAGLDALTPTSQPVGLACSDGDPSPPTQPNRCTHIVPVFADTTSLRAAHYDSRIHGNAGWRLSAALLSCALAGVTAAGPIGCSESLTAGMRAVPFPVAPHPRPPPPPHRNPPRWAHMWARRSQSA